MKQLLDFSFPDMRQRNTTDREKMDRADADLPRLLRTIRQFKLINFLFSGSRRLLREHFFAIMEQDPSRSYTLLDVGAGGCDIALWAAREARKRGLKLEITALDNDPRIFPVAYRAVRDVPEVRIVEGNALELSRLGPFDFVFSNHFLHHLDWEQIELFLERAIAQARLAFLMNDLKRSNWAFLGCTLFIGLLARRSFAFYDGRLSIRRGFLPEELRDFVARKFPNSRIQVREAFPARVALVLATGQNLLRASGH
ncbi:MAG: methyltransferase domain-containing protein [Geobacteraceae bacterium]|nr:methyltransferase domain-containing protein [Geobacteraceae bacterium]